MSAVVSIAVLSIVARKLASLLASNKKTALFGNDDYVLNDALYAHITKGVCK